MSSHLIAIRLISYLIINKLNDRKLDNTNKYEAKYGG